MKPYEKPYFQFPVFSDKVLVFNRDISSDLFAFIEDKFDGGKGYFVEGLPSKEELMKQYWESMNTLDEFLNPSLLITLKFIFLKQFQQC
ncbi:hypothetical protein [Peribacillus simplex]|uniref:Uncharacterized protein n=1 Tax=Peribacillus simplex TaxID=1478 RepID=A0AAW7I601_9BACI|nr:hypothetical protein [Peribacillus simplex]MDM5450950.1 hypothetical protein [Peribacillus simplex]